MIKVIRYPTQMEGDPVIMNQAAALRVKWKRRADPSPCEHLTLVLEWDDMGHSRGNYNCIVCGESVAQRYLAA